MFLLFYLLFYLLCLLSQVLNIALVVNYLLLQLSNIYENALLLLIFIVVNDIVLLLIASGWLRRHAILVVDQVNFLLNLFFALVDGLAILDDPVLYAAKIAHQ